MKYLGVMLMSFMIENNVSVVENEDNTVTVTNGDIDDNISLTVPRAVFESINVALSDDAWNKESELNKIPMDMLLKEMDEALEVEPTDNQLNDDEWDDSNSYDNLSDSEVKEPVMSQYDPH